MERNIGTSTTNYSYGKSMIMGDDIDSDDNVQMNNQSSRYINTNISPSTYMSNNNYNYNKNAYQNYMQNQYMSPEYSPVVSPSHNPATAFSYGMIEATNSTQPLSANISYNNVEDVNNQSIDVSKNEIKSEINNGINNGNQVQSILKNYTTATTTTATAASMPSSPVSPLLKGTKINSVSSSSNGVNKDQNEKNGITSNPERTNNINMNMIRAGGVARRITISTTNNNIKGAKRNLSVSPQRYSNISTANNLIRSLSNSPARMENNNRNNFNNNNNDFNGFNRCSYINNSNYRNTTSYSLIAMERELNKNINSTNTNVSMTNQMMYSSPTSSPTISPTKMNSTATINLLANTLKSPKRTDSITRSHMKNLKKNSSPNIKLISKANQGSTVSNQSTDMSMKNTKDISYSYNSTNPNVALSSQQIQNQNQDQIQKNQNQIQIQIQDTNQNSNQEDSKILAENEKSEMVIQNGGDLNQNVNLKENEDEKFNRKVTNEKKWKNDVLIDGMIQRWTEEEPFSIYSDDVTRLSTSPSSSILSYEQRRNLPLEELVSDSKYGYWQNLSFLINKNEIVMFPNAKWDSKVVEVMTITKDLKLFISNILISKFDWVVELKNLEGNIYTQSNLYYKEYGSLPRSGKMKDVVLSGGKTNDIKNDVNGNTNGNDDDTRRKRKSGEAKTKEDLSNLCRKSSYHKNSNSNSTNNNSISINSSFSNKMKSWIIRFNSREEMFSFISVIQYIQTKNLKQEENMFDFSYTSSLGSRSNSSSDSDVSSDSRNESSESDSDDDISSSDSSDVNYDGIINNNEINFLKSKDIILNPAAATSMFGSSMPVNEIKQRPKSMFSPPSENSLLFQKKQLPSIGLIRHQSIVTKKKNMEGQNVQKPPQQSFNDLSNNQTSLEQQQQQQSTLPILNQNQATTNNGSKNITSNSNSNETLKFLPRSSSKISFLPTSPVNDIMLLYRRQILNNNMGNNSNIGAEQPQQQTEHSSLSSSINNTISSDNSNEEIENVSMENMKLIKNKTEEEATNDRNITEEEKKPIETNDNCNSNNKENELSVAVVDNDKNINNNKKIDLSEKKLDLTNKNNNENEILSKEDNVKSEKALTQNENNITDNSNNNINNSNITITDSTDVSTGKQAISTKGNENENENNENNNSGNIDFNENKDEKLNNNNNNNCSDNDKDIKPVMMEVDSADTINVENGSGSQDNLSNVNKNNDCNTEINEKTEMKNDNPNGSSNTEKENSIDLNEKTDSDDTKPMRPKKIKQNSQTENKEKNDNCKSVETQPKTQSNNCNENVDISNSVLKVNTDISSSIQTNKALQKPMSASSSSSITFSTISPTHSISKISIGNTSRPIRSSSYYHNFIYTPSTGNISSQVVGQRQNPNNSSESVGENLLYSPKYQSSKIGIKSNSNLIAGNTVEIKTGNALYGENMNIGKNKMNSDTIDTSNSAFSNVITPIMTTTNNNKVNINATNLKSKSMMINPMNSYDDINKFSYSTAPMASPTSMNDSIILDTKTSGEIFIASLQQQIEQLEAMSPSINSVNVNVKSSVPSSPIQTKNSPKLKSMSNQSLPSYSYQSQVQHKKSQVLSSYPQQEQQQLQPQIMTPQQYQQYLQQQQQQQQPQMTYQQQQIQQLQQQFQQCIPISPRIKAKNLFSEQSSTVGAVQRSRSVSDSVYSPNANSHQTQTTKSQSQNQHYIHSNTSKTRPRKSSLSSPNTTASATINSSTIYKSPQFKVVSRQNVPQLTQQHQVNSNKNIPIFINNNVNSEILGTEFLNSNLKQDSLNSIVNSINNSMSSLVVNNNTTENLLNGQGIEHCQQSIENNEINGKNYGIVSTDSNGNTTVTNNYSSSAPTTTIPFVINSSKKKKMGNRNSIFSNNSRSSHSSRSSRGSSHQSSSNSNYNHNVSYDEISFDNMTDDSRINFPIKIDNMSSTSFLRPYSKNMVTTEPTILTSLEILDSLEKEYAIY